MYRKPEYWEKVDQEYYRANPDARAEFDRMAAEPLLKLLPEGEFLTAYGRERRFGLLSRLITDFQAASPAMFLAFAAQYLPAGGGTPGRSLRKEIREAAKAQGVGFSGQPHA